MENRYLTRRIDRATLELLPDGSVLIWYAGNPEPMILEAQLVYSLYLFTRLPRVAPLLRKADDERQSKLYETRMA